MQQWVVQLVEDELWKQFGQHQNEMIITKAGRCLFPLYRLRFLPANEGSLQTIIISKECEYQVSVNIEPLDHNKWKWRQGRWTPLLTSRALGHGNLKEPLRRVTFYEKLKGADIIQSGLSFDKLKLSNRESSAGGNSMSICLQSFHRYIPVTTLTNCGEPFDSQTIKFPETEFIAVTHYQNEQVTILKKSYNPHAKGFVISEESPVRGTVNWLLTPEVSSSPVGGGGGGGEEVGGGGGGSKRKRTRKRIHPVNLKTLTDAISNPPSSEAIPSDEEELQGSIALQLLGTSE